MVYIFLHSFYNDADKILISQKGGQTVPKRRKNIMLLCSSLLTAVLGVGAVFAFALDAVFWDNQYSDVIIFAVCSAFGFSSASLIHLLLDQSVAAFPGLKLVELQKPLNLLEGETLYVSNSESLINIAKNQRSEILFYEFSSTMTFFYTLSNNKRFVYVRNLRNMIPIRKRSPVL